MSAKSSSGAAPEGSPPVQRTPIALAVGVGVGSAAFDRHAKAPPAWEVLENGRDTLEALVRRWPLPELGRRTLFEVLDSDPVTRARATPKSVAVHVPSAKMARVIGAASRTVELRFIYYCEYSPDVLLFLDQPLTVEIEIRNTRGYRQKVPYTVDFLVVRADGVYVYQCKARSWLQEQSQEPNPRYVYDTTEAVWRHPAAEKAFRPYGFTHRVFHCGDVNPNWLRNVSVSRRFPFDRSAGWRRRGARGASPVQVSVIVRRLPGGGHHSRGVVLADCLWACGLRPRARCSRPGRSGSACVCSRIARRTGVSPPCPRFTQRCWGRSLASRQRCPLPRPWVAVLFRDLRYDVVSRDAVEVVLCPAGDSSGSASLNPVVISVDSVPALVDSGDLRAVAPTSEELVAQRARRRIAYATNEERVRARERWSIVCEYRSTGAVPSRVHRATLSKYLAWAEEASRVEGSEFLGMLRRSDDASAVPRISGAQHELLRKVAAAFHSGKYSSRAAPDGTVIPIPSRRRVSSAYSDYLRLSKEAHLAPCTPKTLRREIKRYSHEKSERARRGRRAAYPFSPPVGLLEDPIPVHGAFAFDVGAVDHQLLDIWCVSGTTGALLGRPWFTPIIDAYSTMPLGFALRFDPPCVFTVLCAMWDTIARHNRFVNILGSDQGIEFSSSDLDVALAYCRTAHLRRPPNDPALRRSY